MNLEAWQEAGRALEARQKLDLVGVNHPLAKAVIETNLEIERQYSIWLQVRFCRNLARTGWTCQFGDRGN